MKTELPAPSDRASLFIADFSLALINRTGAYYASRDVVTNLRSKFARVRYWRVFQQDEPEGWRRLLLRRLMFLEWRYLGATSWSWPRGSKFLPTVFFDPIYALYAGLDRRDIVLCHDVGPITHPALYEDATARTYKEAYRVICEKAPGMVFVSEASKREFVALFGSQFRSLDVIPLYVRAGAQLGADERPEDIDMPFLLSVGALGERKNFPRAIRAFERSRLHDRGYSYVLCGPRGSDDQETLALAKATPGVVIAGYLRDTELRWLYRNAAGFVLPSLLEGFGMPALEAAEHGLVALVSRGGALEEAAGGGAILVDPMSVDEIAAGMVQLVDMPDEERSSRLSLTRQHAAELTLARFVQSWSDVLSTAPETRGSR
jgi:glycosyltransferase involved in cell wall biosynthesis